MKVPFNQKRYYIMFVIIISLIAFLALQDITGATLWGLLGGWESEAYLKAEPIYLAQFWLFAFMLGAMVSLVYYLFRKDKSEAVAIFASFTVLVLSGLEDIFYYLFRGLPLDASMSWLEQNFFIMGISKFLGQTTVTPTTLLVSVGTGLIITYFIMKKFKKFKW